MTLNISNRWGPYHEYIPYQKPCVVLLNIICLTESVQLFFIFHSENGMMIPSNYMILLGWVDTTTNQWCKKDSPSQKNGMHTNMFCVHVYVHMCVCGCASMCVYILEPPKQRPSIWFWQCCKLSRIWQEKYQCVEEYSKHAEVRMSRISLSVCSLQTALMLNWGIGVLSYLLLHPGRLRNLGSRGVTGQGFRPWKAIQLWFFSLVGLTSILSSEKTHSAGKESMAG